MARAGAEEAHYPFSGPSSRGGAFPVRNTSCTDLIALLDSKWFGSTPRAPAGPAVKDSAYPPRRPLGSQLSNGRSSGSSERLAVGSGDGLSGVVLYPAPAAGDNSNVPQPPRLPPAAPGCPPAAGPAQEQQQPQAVRSRSEPLPANGIYLDAAAAGLAGPAGGAGGGKQDGGPTGGPLGTWANRQRVFLQQQAKQAAFAGAPPNARAAPIEEEQPSGSAGFMPLPPSHGARAGDNPLVEGGQQVAGGGRRREDSFSRHADLVDEEDELNAAWRWRFARKWQTEQAKQFDPEYGKEGGDDEWGDALGYMDALASGLNLQIARTVSTDQYASLPLMSPTLGQSMLLDASIKESPLAASTMDESSMNATKHIVAVARRAQQLLIQQQEIERQVEQRWESATAGQPWAGQHLPAVTVDSWGRFPFVLVRLLDRSNRHKVLVRGRNGAEEAALFAQLEQEVSRAAVQHRLPGPRLELLGSGVMEWSRERDRCLNVTASKLHSLTDARLRSKTDVSKLAGALAQSSLPVTYKILVDGRPAKGPSS